MRRLLWLPGALLAAFTVMRLAGLERGYELVVITAYTPQIAVLALGVTAVLCAFRARRPALLAGLCLVALGALLVPRALPDGGYASGERVTVMSLNAYVGHADADAVVRVARDRGAHVLALQEVTPAFAEALEAAGIRGSFPHAHVLARRGAHGTALYSRRPLRPLPSPPGAFAQAAADIAGVGTVVSVHPPPPTRANLGRRDRDLRALPADAHVLAGDFNATLDHDALRDLMDRGGYRDAAELSGDALRTTWPAGRRWPPEVSIDHVLVAESWLASDVELVTFAGVDHRAVIARLQTP